MKRKFFLVQLIFLIPLAFLAGCTFLYLPPIRSAEPVDPMLDISGSQGLSMEGKVLNLSVLLKTVPHEGWLSVQWFSPTNKQAASDTLWVRPADVGFAMNYALPSDIDLIPGEWRVVMSYDGQFVRQFAYTVSE